MNSGNRTVWAIATAVALVVGWRTCEMLLGGYRWPDAGNGVNGPLSFEHWKAEVHKQVPAMVGLKLENDPTKSFAFFFDPKGNEMMLCWYRSGEIGNGAYGIQIDGDSRNQVKDLPRPGSSFHVRYANYAGELGEYSYSTGLFLQLQSPDMKSFGFSFDVTAGSAHNRHISRPNDGRMSGP